jgi:hypothetical protein
MVSGTFFRHVIANFKLRAVNVVHDFLLFILVWLLRRVG